VRQIEPLGPGNEDELEAFLRQHADSSMFLLSNLRVGGVLDRGQARQATYVAARLDGAIVAVAACCWNGVVLVQGEPDACGEAARAAVAASGRTVTGMSGSWAQVIAARAALDLGDRRPKLDSRERLYAVSLNALRVPDARAGECCRRVESGDVPQLARWRVEYEVEALGAERTPAHELRTIQTFRPAASHWVFTVDGRRVATSSFNAELPECVQIGGVFTPPAERGKGYARAVVAGSLVEARAAGVARAALFTPQDHHAAQRAYEAIGFQVVGDYGLILF
jgi:predicted GNAT family acetyltransferase